MIPLHNRSSYSQIVLMKSLHSYISHYITFPFLSNISTYIPARAQSGLSLINCLAIHIIYLIQDYAMVENSYMLFLILGLVVLFVFLYITYNLFRQINNIVVKCKYLDNKKYTV